MNRPATTLSGIESPVHTKPTKTLSMPRNMIGPSTKPPAMLAGTATSEVCPKVAIDTGAVEMLAALVIAAGSASQEGRNESACVSGRESSSRPATAANESWKLTSNTTFGLMVSMNEPGTSHRNQPSAGRELSMASRPTTPDTPARMIEGLAPVTTT